MHLLVGVADAFTDDVVSVKLVSGIGGRLARLEIVVSSLLEGTQFLKDSARSRAPLTKFVILVLISASLVFCNASYKRNKKQSYKYIITTDRRNYI